MSSSGAPRGGLRGFSCGTGRREGPPRGHRPRTSGARFKAWPGKRRSSRAPHRGRGPVFSFARGGALTSRGGADCRNAMRGPASSDGTTRHRLRHSYASASIREPRPAPRPEAPRALRADTTAIYAGLFDEDIVGRSIGCKGIGGHGIESLAPAADGADHQAWSPRRADESRCGGGGDAGAALRQQPSRSG